MGWRIQWRRRNYGSRRKILGSDAGVVAAIMPPVDVIEYFGTRARVPIQGQQRICNSFVANADGRVSRDAGEQNFVPRRGRAKPGEISSTL